MVTWTQHALKVCFLSAVVGAVQGLYTCEDGWTNGGSKCYKEGLNRSSNIGAVVVCRDLNGTLWRPETAEENTLFINATDTKGVYNIDIRKENKVWSTLGNELTTRMRTLYIYNNFEGNTSGDGCGIFNAATGVWSLSSCSNKERYRCEKEGSCAPGYFGPNCEKECHCAGAPCNPTSGFCNGGCQAGWGGYKCDQKLGKAYGVFYCLEKPDGMKEVIFRSHLNNVRYREISAVDSKGNLVASCGKNSFDIYDGIATLFLNGSGSSYTPDCGARVVNNETTRWQFSFRQYASLNSQYDVIFQITCHWKNVEKTKQSVTVDIHARNRRLRKSTRIVRQQEADHLSLEQSRVNAVVKLVDSESGDEIRNATIGQKVKLVVDFRNAVDVAVKDIAPYNCMATSVDGNKSIALTDNKGCPVKDAPVYLTSEATRLDGDVVYTSREFQVFSFPGHQQVVFTCQIQICFYLSHNCHNRCQYLSGYTKRSVSDVDSQVAGTVLDVRGAGD